jgi:glycosyltransferase involved in cell wall biosynthesis
MTSPLVTTIITTYRRPRLLRRAIRSALNQTMPRVRVCVYDDRSDDETGDVVRALAKEDPRVVYYCHRENIGAPANFEFGVQRVETPFFSILSDDDLLLPNYYERAIADFDRHPEAKAVVGETLYMKEDGTFLGDAASRFSLGLHLPPDNLLEMAMYPQPSWTGILFRSEVRSIAGTLDTSLFSMDYDFVLRVAATCPYTVLHDPVALFTVHPGQSTAILRLHMVWPTRYAAIQKVCAIESIPANVRKTAERFLMDDLKRLLFRIGMRALLLRKPDECSAIVSILQDSFHASGLSRLLRLGRIFAGMPFFLDALDGFHVVRRKLIEWRVRDQAPRLPEFHTYSNQLTDSDPHSAGSAIAAQSAFNQRAIKP